MLLYWKGFHTAGCMAVRLWVQVRIILLFTRTAQSAASAGARLAAVPLLVTREKPAIHSAVQAA